jgi:hypothetical protein
MDRARGCKWSTHGGQGLELCETGGERNGWRGEGYGGRWRELIPDPTTPPPHTHNGPVHVRLKLEAAVQQGYVHFAGQGNQTHRRAVHLCGQRLVHSVLVGVVVGGGVWWRAGEARAWSEHSVIRRDRERV